MVAHISYCGKLLFCVCVHIFICVPLHVEGGYEKLEVNLRCFCLSTSSFYSPAPFVFEEKFRPVSVSLVSSRLPCLWFSSSGILNSCHHAWAFAQLLGIKLNGKFSSNSFLLLIYVCMYTYIY